MATFARASGVLRRCFSTSTTPSIFNFNTSPTFPLRIKTSQQPKWEDSLSASVREVLRLDPPLPAYSEVFATTGRPYFKAKRFTKMSRTSNPWRQACRVDVVKEMALRKKLRTQRRLHKKKSEEGQRRVLELRRNRASLNISKTPTTPASSS
eukprot:TRINITY_DN5616_c0_g1::TRINITY_DN5616_c0_g1_i1::g.12161::m.12161 TRINITY_DN5616_c0_g1::TRINITY_DN5616_c0_g1_i1::g.12161  ORF type:complete len:160 (-),score=0.50 TRINITY_DN5616_c0_g1_i1:244-699(-)